MNIRLLGLRSLFLLATCFPCLNAAAASGIQVMQPDQELLLKINFEVEWLASEIPVQLNAAQVIHNLPLAKRLATRYDTQVRETFRDRLDRVLQAAGYRSRLKLIEDAPEADRGKPLLIVTLKRWAVDHRRRFDCHFTARLATPSGQADLGEHDYTDIQLHEEYAKGRHVGAEKATDEALGRFLMKLSAHDQLALPAAGRP